MGLYARSDVASVTVPVTSGGCGAVHSRPVANGVPEEEWNLESQCPKCAKTRRGDPLWAAMPADVPETPDEKRIREDAEKRGEKAVKKAQQEISVRQQELTERIVQLLERGGTPAQLPDASLVARLVQEEIARVLAEPQTDPAVPVQVNSDEEPGLQGDLFRLHVRTLGKMCRDKGLDDKGSKADLIARLKTVA